MVSRVVRSDTVLYDDVPYQGCAMFIQVISTQVPYRTAYYGTTYNPDCVPTIGIPAMVPLSFVQGLKQ
jgi:hypothetical protein